MALTRGVVAPTWRKDGTHRTSWRLWSAGRLVRNRKREGGKGESHFSLASFPSPFPLPSHFPFSLLSLFLDISVSHHWEMKPLFYGEAEPDCYVRVYQCMTFRRLQLRCGYITPIALKNLFLWSEWSVLRASDGVPADYYRLLQVGWKGPEMQLRWIFYIRDSVFFGLSTVPFFQNFA